jgi:valyl-tRNA synthetase
MSKSLGNVIDPLDLVEGAQLDELRKRIMQSNLNEKEKKTSIQNQEKLYPNGIDAVGSDSTRIALLIQDFKSDNININPNMFSDSKRYCNKIWQAVRYSEVCIDSNTKSQFRLKTINQVKNFCNINVKQN